MAREHEKQKTKESNSEDSTMTDNVLAAARLILDGIAKAGPGIGTVPFLQPAAQATLSIAEAINTVRDNKEDLQELVQDAERVILAIYSTYETSEDKNAWPGQGLEDVLKKLISTLQEINCLAKRRANRNVARRLLTAMKDTKKIIKYHRALDEAKDRFTLTSQIKANEMLLRIEARVADAVRQIQETEKVEKAEVKVKQANLAQVKKEKNEADVRAKEVMQKLKTEIDFKQERLRREDHQAKEREKQLEKARLEAEEEEEKAKEWREAENLIKYQTELRELRERTEAARRRTGKVAQQSRAGDAQRQRQEEEASRPPQCPIPGLPTTAIHENGVSFFNGVSGLLSISGSPQFNIQQANTTSFRR